MNKARAGLNIKQGKYVSLQVGVSSCPAADSHMCSLLCFTLTHCMWQLAINLGVVGGRLSKSVGWVHKPTPPSHTTFLRVTTKRRSWTTRVLAAGKISVVCLTRPVWLHYWQIWSEHNCGFDFIRNKFRPVCFNKQRKFLKKFISKL